MTTETMNLNPIGGGGGLVEQQAGPGITGTRWTLPVAPGSDGFVPSGSRGGGE